MSVNCAVCANKLSFQWCDQHGVGACINCGLPYTIYHYEKVDGKDTRVDRPPSIAVKESWIPLAKKYWDENKRRVFPAAYDMGFLGGRETSYSGATREDCELFDCWLDKHRDEFPINQEDAA